MGDSEMSTRFLGLGASRNEVICVDVEIHDNSQPIVVLLDHTWKIQEGDRGAAYNVLYQQCADYVRENQIDRVIVKASAVTGQGAARLGMLLSAEVRGVVIAAAASASAVSQLSKAVISRTYGDRNVDEYVSDDAFWAEYIEGKSLRKKSREVAMLLIAARDG